ncbi:MAG: M18 family aminopeptidase [Defluviitaleaceae bacterium]|nr:M18 family aminopeptidase [Defluviitaleaceae bacterium]
MKDNAQKLLDYIYNSPTAYHATSNGVEELKKAGFTQLFEGEAWDMQTGGKYFVAKNGSAFAAWIVGLNWLNPSVRVIAAHTDSPAFVIKPNPQMTTGKHIKLNTSPYGGMILHTWFDRPLALAGRVLLKSSSFLAPEERLININRPLMVIPSLAIHLNREVNKGVEFNPQNHTLPFVAMVNEELEKDDYLLNLLTEELKCNADDILDFDLTLYEYARNGFVGGGKFLSSPRLDDLWMVHAGLEAILQADAGPFTKLLFCPDNEEIGSMTAWGAHSRFIQSILERIVGRDKFDQAMANSFIVSADLGHAQNPNYADKDDPTSPSIMGEGPILKYSAMQKYATNGYTAAVFRGLCERAGVPCQAYITRSDITGGGTIGAMMSAKLGCAVVDMGLAVMGMHSIRELGAVIDNEYALKLFKAFYDNEVK